MYDEEKKLSGNIDPLSIIPSIPVCCNRGDCGNDAAIAFIRVQRNDGKHLTGAASDFCFSKKNTGWILRNDFMFRGWVARCAGCYCEELEGARKQQLKAERPDHRYLLNKPHEERMIVLRNVLKRAAFREMPEPETKDYAGDRYADEEREAIQAETTNPGD